MDLGLPQPKLRIKRNHPGQQQRAAKQRRLQLRPLQFVSVPDRSEDPGEIGTAPPPASAAPSPAVRGRPWRHAVVEQLTEALCTIQSKEAEIKILHGNLRDADSEIRAQKKQIKSLAHRAECFQQRIRQLLPLVPSQPSDRALSSASPKSDHLSSRPFKRPHSPCPQPNRPSPRPRSRGEPSN